MKMIRSGVLAAVLAASAMALTGGATAPEDSDAVPRVEAPRGSEETLDALVDLAGTQSDDVISRAMESGVPVEVLWDTDAGGVIAAVEVEPGRSTRAISMLGPGCSSTSVCLKTPTPHGYAGTGTLSGKWNNVSYLFAGTDRATRFYFTGSSQSVELRPSVSLRPVSNLSINKITR